MQAETEMKKFSALLIILVLVLSLAACGKKNEENKATGTPEPTKEATTPEPTKEATPEPTEEVTPEPTEEVTPEPTEEVTPEPTEEATPEPTEEVTPEPTEEPGPEPTEEATPEPTEGPAEDDVFTKSEGVMTYQEYVDAELESEVVVETFVQDKQSWWEDKATIYTQDNEGAYFIYEMACSQEDYGKLVVGQKIKVTGYKSEWQGEVEIIDASFEFLDGSYIAEPVDVTEYLGTDEMINFQNQYVLFKGMTVAASQDADGNEAAFLYKWNGSGQEGDDLYFNVEYNGQIYTFTVESYLRDKDSDVYQAVKNLNIGDKIDLAGYAYWYDTLNPHIITVVAAEE